MCSAGWRSAFRLWSRCRAFSLESRRHIHRITMQVSSIGNRIANVDSDAEADGSVEWLIAVVDRYLLLNPRHNAQPRQCYRTR